MYKMGEDGASFAEFVEKIAAEAGLKVIKRSHTLVIVLFNMGEGRKQNVFVKPLGLDHKGNLVIGFSSPALQMPADQLLSQDVANDLLRKNTKFAHGSWGIERQGENDYLVAFSTQLAHTMQPQEFEAIVRMLSRAADDMEKKLGVDLF